MKNSNGLITGIVMVLVFVAGFALGHFTAFPVETTDKSPSAFEAVRSGAADSSQPASADQAAAAVAEEGTTIDASVMTAGQRKLLGSLGVDADSITVTPEMISCAQNSLGDERVTAIQNGDTPSFLEGTKLLSCYTKG